MVRLVKIYLPWLTIPVAFLLAGVVLLPERETERGDLPRDALTGEKKGRSALKFHALTRGGLDETPLHTVNRPGLTHLSFRVDDLGTVVSDVERLGGRVLAGSEIDNPRFSTKAVFVVDPDGLRIELLQTPGDPDSLPGAG